MIRVLIVDASSAGREQVATLLGTDPEIELAGEAGDGAEAVELARRLCPDVIVMNASLPGGNGLETTKTIMAEQPTPIVILSDQTNRAEVVLSLHALRAGALAVGPIPRFSTQAADEASARDFLDTVKSMSQVKLVRRWKAQSAAASRKSDKPKPLVVAVAASTGGPAALQRILSDLPIDFPLPIVAVQHISKGFVSGLVDWLNATSPLRVKLARHGEELAARTLYLAADDYHLGVTRDGRLALASSAPIGGFRPSADYLLASVAKVFGRAAIAVMLTGMGQDGVEGLRAMRRVGGSVLVQDEATSVVFGMPRAAIEAGVADAVLPLSQIAARLVALAQ